MDDHALPDAALQRAYLQALEQGRRSVGHPHAVMTADEHESAIVAQREVVAAIEAAPG